MDKNHIDTVRLRALPTRFTFPDGTVFEQIGDGSFKKTDLAGNHNGYFKAENIVYKDSLKAELLASRMDEDRAAARILDQGVDRTPQQL